MVKNGYELPFTTTPPKFWAKNNASSLRNKNFVEESIVELLKNNCIEEVSEAPYCVNPLTVAEGEKLRLVLDLRHVNRYLKMQKFKYENLHTVAELFEKDFFFGTFDLKSGYHHVEIAEEFRTYLGFAWTHEDGITRFYRFLVLPFGLATACYVFTKLLRPLVKRWRSQGIRCVIYLDDGIAGGKAYSETQKILCKVKSDIISAGLTLNIEKTKLEPRQKGKWLGFIIDTHTQEFFVPQEKIQKTLSLINTALEKPLNSAKDVSKIAGHIISMSLAIGPLARLFTRGMYKFIESRYSWNYKQKLDDLTNFEMTFWLKNLQRKNGFTFKHHPTTTKIVYSDASKNAYGGYIVERLGNIIARGDFTEFEKDCSSTYRELICVKYMLESFGHLLQHENVLWFSDNHNVSRIISAGSGKVHLQNIALQIYNSCLKFQIKLEPTWLPREENELADEISKELDTDNWSIDDETFQYIQKNFGKFTCDRFADNLNYRVKHFNSKYYCPETSAVNAFTCHWGGEFNWLCPPTSLIGRTLRHCALCKAIGVLLVPEWVSAYFWPLLTNDGKTFISNVKCFLLLDPFYHNNSGSVSVFQGFTKFRTYALYLDFSERI